MTAYEKCEFPGCEKPATVRRPQSSGDVLVLCGEPHVLGEGWLEVEDDPGFLEPNGNDE